MTKKKPSAGLGRALANAQKTRVKDPTYKDSFHHVSEGVAAQEQIQKSSCLEQTTLDDFIATAELANVNFAAVRGRGVVVGDKQIVEKKREGIEGRPDMQDMIVPIPRRPHWTPGISKDQLLELENEAFLIWRKKLAAIEEDLNCIMTPFERNFDFWRQLWRVIEKSDLVVYIVDARDPLFYRCIDLENYVKENPTKKVMILLNKTDYQSEEIRGRWVEYFKKENMDVLCFSALKELEKLGDFVNPEKRRLDVDDIEEREEEGVTAVLGDGLEGATDVLDVESLIARLRQMCPANNGRQTIGFVGYPNVGKSSVINALFGKKKASMSRQPGKTRHFQTLEIEDNLTLCDCPGLVFPKVVATKAHLVINNTMSVDQLRNFHQPCQIIADKVGLPELFQRYGVPKPDKVKKVGDFLAAFAKNRRHFLRLGVPDEKWSARRVLRDFVTGRLLHCEDPCPEEATTRPRAESDETADLDALAEEEFASDFEFEPDGNPRIERDDTDDVNSKSRNILGKQHITKRAQRREKKLAMLQRNQGEEVD
eukprot:GEMP01038980.1.p1 GENE.GEMP01038980.1~~GEMP01038980.1.p1  ORF type:complete len:539 (+),score=100.17 GEMP01038980.1:27-1643(+)